MMTPGQIIEMLKEDISAYKRVIAHLESQHGREVYVDDPVRGIVDKRIDNTSKILHYQVKIKEAESVIYRIKNC